MLPTSSLSRLLFALLISVQLSVEVTRASSPLDNAQALWQFGDANEASGRFEPLSAQGDVKLGVALTGAERNASLQCGGDGQAALFNGGYFRAISKDNRRFQLEGKTMTLVIRLQDSDGRWTSPLFAKDASQDPYNMVLWGDQGTLTYLWQAEPMKQQVKQLTSTFKDFVDGVLRLRVPMALTDAKRWHEVAMRFRGANLELFVDGVLVDEEWPHGALYQFAAPFLIGAGYQNGKLQSSFHGMVDYVALWNRALSDTEITQLAGGPEAVARREVEINGPVQPMPQYWKPRGYNAWAGDCMPFYHDGVFHLFYLFDRHHHGSKWGQGAHQYAHLSSNDLIHWEQQPLAVPIVEQWECSMGTCDCIWHDGVYYMFYTDCGSRCEYNDKPQEGSWIFVSRSTDGIHFQKDLKPLVSGGDCTVFRDPATGLFHLVRGGGNRLVSKDLKKWEEIPGDFVQRTDPNTTGECPHLFAWNGWYYFILGTNAVWKSRSALGPWEPIEPTIYDGLFVPKVAEFKGNRRILAGFMFNYGWAGHLALRELTQSPDGSLGMKFVPELIPASGDPQSLKFVPLASAAVGDQHKISLQTKKPFAAAALEGMAPNVRITMRVVPQAGVKCYGLCLRGKDDYEGGCELRFEPSRKRVQYGTPVNHGLAKDAKDMLVRGQDHAIENVKQLDRPFNLDIIVKNDLVDTCIDGRRVVITRRGPEMNGDRLFFFAGEGGVTFDSIQVRPLIEPGRP